MSVREWAKENAPWLRPYRDEAVFQWKRPYRAWRAWSSRFRIRNLPDGRQWQSNLTNRAHIGLMRGALNYRYRGMRAIRYPIDIAIYLMLLQELRPQTVIEIGSREGGGAALMGDLLNMLDIPSRVYSIDLARAEPKYQPFNVQFYRGDENDLGLVPMHFPELRHPWLVINDASHQYSAIMNCLSFLNKYMRSGDYAVVEDGYITEIGEDGGDRKGGPARAIADFLHYSPDWRIDARLCDFYGKNVTANANGYLVKS